MNRCKSKFAIVSIVVMLIAFSLPVSMAAADNDNDIAALRRTSRAFVAVAKKATPAVVSVTVEKTIETSSRSRYNSPFDFGSPFDDDFFERYFGPRSRQRAPQKQKKMGQGSGFIISADGYILTNNHLVREADKITVTLKDGRELAAETIGTDPQTDVAVIKVDAKDMPVIELGDSDKLEVGEWVIAVGNPFGLVETVTVGVVSAKGRSGFGIVGSGGYEDFIQTDAAINPGNSGGPLLDIDGKAIGLNTFIVSQSGGYMGIGFAVPINIAKAIKDQLVETGKVTRGFVGIEMLPQNITPELAEHLGLEKPQGVIIRGVLEDSPAEKGDLKIDDVIIKLNGRDVENYVQFRNKVSLLAPGTKIKLTIFRDGKEIVKTLTIGSMEEFASALGTSELSQKFGLEVEELTKEMADKLGYDMGEGVLVAKVTKDSSADDVGIEPGMLILSVNRKYVNSVEEYNTALEKSAETGTALMLIGHNNTAQYVVLSIKE